MSAEVIDQVLTRFEADVGKAIADVQKYVAALNAAGKAEDDSGKTTGRSARGHDDLQKSIYGVIQAERQQGRAARFVALEARELLGVNDKLVNSFAELGLAAAEGAAFGIAFEAIKVGVAIYEKWKEKTEEVAKAQRELKTATMEAHLEFAKWLASIGPKQTESEWGKRVVEETTEAFKELAKPENAKLSIENINKVKKELAELEEKRTKLAAKVPTAGPAEIDQVLLDIAAADGKIAKLREDVDALETKRAKIMAPLRTTMEGRTQAERAERAKEDQKIQEDASKDAVRIAEEQERATRQAHREGLLAGADEYRKITLQATFELEDLERQRGESISKIQAATGAERARVFQAFADREVAIRQGAMEKITAEDQKQAAEAAKRAEDERRREDEQAQRSEFERLKAIERERQKQIVESVDRLADHEAEYKARKAAGTGNAAVDKEIAEVEAKYNRLIEDARLLGESEVELERQKEEEKKAIRDKYAAEQMTKITQQLMEEAQKVMQVFLPVWQAAWTKAGTTNKAYTKEYAKLSEERRERDLIDQGIAKTTAEAHAIAAQEQAAAEAQKTAAEKQGIADRMAALAMEWGIRAIASAAEGKWQSAAAFTAAAVAAAALAAKFHGEAVSLSNSRGYTQEERDSLYSLESDKREGAASSGGGAGGGGQTVIREKMIVFYADPLSTPAEEARRFRRAEKLATELDQRYRTE